MAYKFVIVALALTGLTNAAVVVPAAPALRAAPLAVAPAPAVLAKTVELEEYDPHPQYKYGYNVQDTLSGDSKGHVEERDGEIVRGEYSLIDADGFKRTVSYIADPVNGFNAVVRREPIVLAAEPIVAAPARLAVAAPAPVAVAAPARLAVAAPAPVAVAAPARLAVAAPAPVAVAAPARLAVAAPAPVVRTAAYTAPAYYVRNF